MLTDFAFSNYRAFKRGQVSIKPLTIVVGPNSVGKTALLQVPLLIKQTAILGDSKFRGALRIHGRDVSFGQPKQLFHNLDTSNDITFEFGFTSERLLREISRELVDEVLSSLFSYVQYAVYVASRTKPSLKADVTIIKQITLHRKELEKFLSETSDRPRPKELDLLQHMLDIVEPLLFVTKNVVVEDKDKDFLFPPFLEPGIRGPLMPRRFRPPTLSLSDADVRRIIHYCLALRQMNTDAFSVQFSVGLTASADQVDQAGILFIKSLAVKNAAKELFALVFSGDQVVSARSQLIDSKQVDQRHSDLTKLINFHGSIFNVFERYNPPGSVLSSAIIIKNVISLCINELSKNVSGTSIEHIGPLRAYPKAILFYRSKLYGTIGRIGCRKAERK